MRQKLQKNNRGFTIIEVLIVLAIAGLILLIVFLAVPALQRTARNTQRKNDAASLLGGVSNYISNNGGVVPGSVAPGANGTGELICGANCNPGTGNTELAKLGYYDPANITLTTAVPAAFPDTKSVTIVTGVTCPDQAGTLPGTANVNARSAVALFSLENGSGGQTNICQEQ